MLICCSASFWKILQQLKQLQRQQAPVVVRDQLEHAAHLSTRFTMRSEALLGNWLCNQEEALGPGTFLRTSQSVLLAVLIDTISSAA